eukprot:6333554-Alexandrium_andersonii.AAC.1
MPMARSFCAASRRRSLRMARKRFAKITASGSTSALSMPRTSYVRACGRPTPGPGPRYSAILPRGRASS